MSTPQGSHPPRTIPCPRCGATLGPEQDWCLTCGAPARTRLAPLPNWRLPVAVVATLSVAAIVALILAFVSLTSDDGTVAGAPTTAPIGATGVTGLEGLPSTTPSVADGLPATTAAVTVPTTATTLPSVTTTTPNQPNTTATTSGTPAPNVPGSTTTLGSGTATGTAP